MAKITVKAIDKDLRRGVHSKREFNTLNVSPIKNLKNDNHRRQKGIPFADDNYRIEI